MHDCNTYVHTVHLLWSAWCHPVQLLPIIGYTQSSPQTCTRQSVTLAT